MVRNTKINAIFVHVKTTYCFHKPTFLKLVPMLINSTSKIINSFVTQSTLVGFFQLWS